MYYNLDWDKVIELIFEKNLAWIVAGLNGDWDMTRGTIFKNGKPVLSDKIEPTFFSCSTWAIPAIEYYDEEERKIVHENCFFEDEAKPRDPSSPWPSEYLEKYWRLRFEENREKKSKKMDTPDDRARVKEKISEKHLPKNSKENSVSFKNSIKALETHSTAIKTEFARLFRLVPKEEMSEEGINSLMRAVAPLVTEMVEFLDEFAKWGRFNQLMMREKTKESDEEFLNRVFRSVPKIFKKVMEEKEEANSGSIEDEEKILKFTETATDFLVVFRNLLEGYLVWKARRQFQIDKEDLKNIKGGDSFN